MAPDQSALLELLGELKLTDICQRQKNPASPAPGFFPSAVIAGDAGLLRHSTCKSGIACANPRPSDS